uniref:Complex I-B14.7 n=1 Tax=Strongyloides venezuelensis TaxID=75913 RepID=A0A0K0F8V1_STRVS
MHEEVLKATYRTQRPPWIGLWTSTEHKGRPDWWAEADFKTDDSKKGIFRIFRPRFNEENPDWYDPKVEDGTSIAGPCGLDSKKHKNITVKGDTPGDLKCFQDDIEKNSVQYKSIAEKFELSKEHPGISINPTLQSYSTISKNTLGHSSFYSKSWYHFGPRFFDKPLNEGTLEKGLACVKYMAIFMAPFTLAQLKTFRTLETGNLTGRAFFKQYLKNAPLPFTASFAWGTALSTAAVIRNKDDCQNHLFASAALGSVVGTMKNNFSTGISVAVASAILGVFWQYQRWSKEGIQGMTLHQTTSGFQGGPLIWQWLQLGDHEVPSEKY